MPLTQTRVPREELLQWRYDITAEVIYVGHAPHGSDFSSPVWTITRTLFDAAGLPTEKGCHSDALWADRASLSYS